MPIGIFNLFSRPPERDIGHFLSWYCQFLHPHHHMSPFKIYTMRNANLVKSSTFKRKIIQTEMDGWFRQTILCTFQNSNKTFSTNIISSFLNLGPEFYASFSALGFLSQKDFKLEKNLSLYCDGKQFFLAQTIITSAV